MGCFFTLFRLRGTTRSSTTRVSESLHPSIKNEVVKSGLSTTSIDSPFKIKEISAFGTSESCTAYKGLKDEKVSKELEVFDLHRRNADTLNFHTCLPSTSSDEHCEESGALSISFEDTPPSKVPLGLEYSPTALSSSSAESEILNPVENFSQCTVLNEERSSNHQVPHQQGETNTIEKHGETVSNFEAKKCYFGRTPSDRPILGTVAAYWNEEMVSDVLQPKWWDGNGIPNSTNKYKEDQKVNWHNTPFKERLEKAISEESLISQRGHNWLHVDYSENDETDTTMSQMKPSPHPKPLVSF